jgi:folate-binding protein YgfZ
MARVSPLRNIHLDAKAQFLVYGDAPPVEMVSTFGSFELEYAAIRRGVGLCDQPNRGVIELTGADRLEFLNRMLTQQLASLGLFSCARSFWLNRKGRIDADFRVLHLPERTLLELDVHALPHALQSLDAYLITEDASMQDVTDRTHRLGAHGPRAAQLIDAVSEPVNGPAVATLQENQACEVSIDGAQVVADRQDSLGTPGFELYCAAEDAEHVWMRLNNEGRPEEDDGPSPFRQRAVGWAAVNTARIEAGWPLFNVDFGPNSLPAETGVLRDRVSFKKGGYLGQEIVARMDSRKSVKQTLAAIKIDRPDPDAGGPTVPITGEAVLDADAPEDESIGAVTSSALSPMLGDTPICFAQIKSSFAEAGKRVLLSAQGKRMTGETQESLRFLKDEATASAS